MRCRRSSGGTRNHFAIISHNLWVFRVIFFPSLFTLRILVSSINISRIIIVEGGDGSQKIVKNGGRECIFGMCLEKGAF